MKHGFTLVELLVAIAIFGLISAAAVANLRGSNPNAVLRQQAGNAASFIRQAQVQAMSGEPFAGSVPVGGYGVYVELCAVPPCALTLFADQNANFEMEAPAEVVQTINLGSAVTVEAISTGNPSAILFRPPSGAACFNDACSDAGTASITFGARGTDNLQTVGVNQISGQISQ